MPFFKEAKSGTMMSKIGDKLRNCPNGGCSLSNYEKMIKSILESNTAGILVSDDDHLALFV